MRATIMRPPWLMLLALGAFLGISFWWLLVDTGGPTIDGGGHLLTTHYYSQLIGDGDLERGFQSGVIYPPLVYALGGTVSLILGESKPVLEMAQNVVFVPLLALGCYGAGRAAFDRRVGALAATFALAAPLLIAMFHDYLLDGPETAMVAVSVWLLIASERFQRLDMSLLAGLAVGFGALTKNTFGLFVAGLVLMLLLRGGWRNWRNFLLFAALAGAIGMPWYLVNYDLLHANLGVVNAPPVFWYGHVSYPPAWSAAGFGWYGWNLINNQLFLPLATLFAIGLPAAAIRWIRSRERTDYTPELIAGGLLGFFTQSLITLKDPRYTLPCLVYVALLSTAWIVRARPVIRRVGIAAVALSFVVNHIAISFGALGGSLWLRPFGGPPSPIREHQLAILAREGVNGPDRSSHLREIIEGAHRVGAHQLVWFTAGDDQNMSAGGLSAMLVWDKLPNPHGNDPSAAGPHDVLLYRDPGNAAPVPACSRFPGGSYLYLIRGARALLPLSRYPKESFICPLRG